MTKREKVARFCIYTMRHTNELANIYSRDRSGVFEERKKWATGSRLFHAAQQEQAMMLIFFGAADVASGLLYWARIQAVQIDESNPKAPTTAYHFSNLTRLDGGLPLSSLTLRDTGKPLSDKYIRPYAVCFTPAFLLSEGMQ